MSCHRLRREILELFRFGGLDLRSAPHLDHLADCRDCRDEVGIDRVLVQRLRLALAERVAGADPSATTWSSILERAQAPEPGIGRWLRDHGQALVSRLRVATGGIALVLLMVVGADVALDRGDPLAMPSLPADGAVSAAAGAQADPAASGRRPGVKSAPRQSSRRVQAVTNKPMTRPLPATPGFQLNLDPRGLAAGAVEDTDAAPAGDAETVPADATTEAPAEPSPIELAR